MAHLRPTTLACALGGIVVALAMALGAPRTTPAETVEEMEQSIREIEQSIEEMGRQVQDAAAVYAEAMANVEVLQSSIDENQGRIDVVEREIPEQRERSASAIRTLYKMSQNKNGLIDLMLSSDDFNSFITTMTYMNIIEERNTDEAERLVRLQNELRSVEAELNAQHDEAEQEREKADEALRQAEELRSKAIEEKARLEAEQRARKAAEEAAKAAQAAAQANAQALIGSDDLSALADAVAKAGPTNQPIPNQPAPATPPSDEPGIEAPPSNPDRDSFVQEWAQRIDQYLAGSPLEGHGRTFAEAAYDFGVDPRWSPAISNTESTKGRFCFLPHNAWGWGQASWPDWDTAIRAHVQGLSEGYGYTISEANAEKYCPPTWQAWYATTLAEMAKI